MRRDRRWRSVCWRGLAGALLVVGAARAAGSQASLPEGKGKDLVETVCTQCHGLSNVTNSRFSKADWKMVVGDMISRGAPLTEEETATAVVYLAEHFGREKAAEGSQTEKVNVNKATAKELAAGLGLSDKEAEAVVEHRQKNGAFAKWEDLTKVPDLDTKKIEAKKDQLAF